MRNSKAIKPESLKEDEPSWKLNLKLWWWDLPPIKAYHNLRVTISRLKRVYQWSKFMWTNWDFDALSIYPLLEYKLKRVQFCLLNGHAVQDPKDLKALRIALKLAKRLSIDYHENKLYYRHERKWGELKTWFTPTERGDGSSYWNSTRANIKMIKIKQQREKII